MPLLVIAHDRFDPSGAKTANALIKYGRDPVVAVVDRQKAGRDAGEFLGPHGKGIPIVASVAEGLRFQPTAVAIGIAPVGGALPEHWRGDLRTALGHGLPLISGLHTFLGNDPELAALASRHGARIWDVRKHTRPHRIATAEGARVPALVVTHVGTDCNSGKMTTAVELTQEARARGLNAAFVATGQTGIMIGCDAGAPIDAIVSDFVAGAVEEMVLECARRGFNPIFVEGQGSITHPAYSGVTCGLLHGSFPDLLVMSDEPRREYFGAFGPAATVKVRKNSLPVEIDLNERLTAPFTGAKVAALSLVTRGLSDADYQKEVERAERETGVPAADVFRGGRGKLLDAVLAAAERQGFLRNGQWDFSRKLARGQ
ncbi:MAG TPA: DUF1611 domain-containing protein [Candidatus Thermoplasmatota archaeon]|nr:DUF1611 domain-containing protein [Candidatus Thermoplasmatota archaeon]